MSILESLHAERRMSMNHWRFRILHWCFNENAETPEESSLPRYLYTHYCPLFHLTNFIALFSWLILLVKVIVAVVSAIADVVSGIDWSSWMPERKVREPSEISLKKQQWKTLVQFVLNDKDYEDFDYLWRIHGSQSFGLLDKEETRKRHEDLVSSIKEARERSEARKEKMRARILFWVNFSRVFVSWFLYAFYVAVAIVALWLAYVCVGPLVGIVKWLFAFEYASLLPFLVIGAKVGFLVLLSFIFVVLMHRFSVVQRCTESAVRGAVMCSPPFVLLWAMISAPFVWVWNGLNSCYDFVVMFYEENCPPITMISEDEEAIEEAV